MCTVHLGRRLQSYIIDGYEGHVLSLAQEVMQQAPESDPAALLEAIEQIDLTKMLYFFTTREVFRVIKQHRLIKQLAK
eukprot:6475428-Amphidinium_carterae.1